MKHLRFWLSAAALLALCLCAPANAESQMLDVNYPLWLDSGTYRFEFIPPVGGYYTFFTYGSNADITLYQDNDAISVEEDSILLNSSSTYRMDITVAEPIRFEIMRSARGKSILEPIELTTERYSYSKVIAREGDTHWYCFTPESDGVFTIASEPGDDRFLLVSGHLYDENYYRVAEAEGIESMNGFVIQESLIAGKTYYLRIHSKENTAGEYILNITAGGISSPTNLTLLETELTIYLDEQRNLNVRVFPLGAHEGLRYISENPEIAMVTQSGTILPRSAGETVIHVYSYGSAQTECRVIVPEIEPDSISLSSNIFELHAGESLRLEYRIFPEETTNRDVFFSVSDESIVSISEDGIITGIAEGEALFAVFTSDGMQYDTARAVVTKTPAHYRALIAGVHGDTHESERTGAVNTTNGIADMLLDMKGTVYEVTTLIDPAYEDLSAGINAAFAGATPSDISLIYINAHGGITDGTAWLCLADGYLLTAQSLELSLRKIPGVVVVIIDCCQSGAFIGNQKSFCDAVISAFSTSPFASSKYKILTSSAANEDSYRISSGSIQTEESMATVFGRSLAEGAGWDLIKDKSAVMRADLERDRAITLHEIFLYTKKRTNWRLSTSDVRQTVQIYPEGDPLILFAK